MSVVGLSDEEVNSKKVVLVLLYKLSKVIIVEKRDAKNTPSWLYYGKKKNKKTGQIMRSLQQMVHG